MKNLFYLSVLSVLFCSGCGLSNEEIAISLGLTYKSQMIPTGSMEANENWSNSLTINLESIYDEIDYTDRNSVKLKSCKIKYLYARINDMVSCKSLSDIKFSVELPGVDNIVVQASDSDVVSTCDGLSNVLLVGIIIPGIDSYATHKEYDYLLNHDFVKMLQDGESIIIKYDISNGDQATQGNENGIFVEAALDVEVEGLE